MKGHRLKDVVDKKKEACAYSHTDGRVLRMFPTNSSSNQAGGPTKRLENNNRILDFRHIMYLHIQPYQIASSSLKTA